MSYKEIVQGVYQRHNKGLLLSSYEIKQLQSSLQNPFLKKLFSIYPLDNSTKKFLRDSLEKALTEAHGQAIDLDVHSALYGGQREKTLKYLITHYPPGDSTDLIGTIESFLTHVLQQPEAQKQLLIAEAERYKIREKLYHDHKLATLDKSFSLEQIIADFKDYIEYLRCQKNIGTTYAWDVIESLFIRRDMLKTTQELEESDMQLLLALDDSRTAYHDKDYEFVKGKNYTCQKGLLERLLDFHQSMIPEQQVFKSDDVTELIESAIKPFVSAYQEGEQASRRICSQFFYQLYLQAAHYTTREKQINVYAFKSDIDINALKKKYEQSLEEQKRPNQKQELFEWDLAVAKIKHALLLSSDATYGKVISFLDEHHALERVNKNYAELVAIGPEKSDEEVFMAMLKQGPFIDKAHLELILSILNPLATFETLRHMAQLGTEGEEDATPLTRTGMVLAYQKYLAQSEDVFYPFVDEEHLRKKLQDCVEPHAIPCSQTAFCDWLERETTVLTPKQAKIFSCLCAQKGYHLALKVLLHNRKYRVSPNHIDPQQGCSLLYIAAKEGHSAVVRLLISARADIDLAGKRDNFPPLIIASERGYTSIVNMLINAGADVNIQTQMGNTALRCAVKEAHFSIVNALLKAGANPNLKNKSGSSALTVCISNNIFSGVFSGIFTIDEKIRDRDIASLKELIDAEKIPTYYIIEGIKKYIHDPQYHDVVKILLQDRIAQCLVRNKHQMAPIAWAARYRCLEALRAFYKAGASIDQADEFDKTALMYAKEQGDVKIETEIHNLINKMKKKNAKIFFRHTVERRQSGRKTCS